LSPAVSPRILAEAIRGFEGSGFEGSGFEGSGFETSGFEERLLPGNTCVLVKSVRAVGVYHGGSPG